MLLLCVKSFLWLAQLFSPDRACILVIVFVYFLGLLRLLCSILMSTGIPADILTEVHVQCIFI